ncbi:hypothetical protein Sjap_023821 [Stephania japonica]|uniref:Polygalacturonase n=1 Tax=Stephania japonica TaxID=461633 RepID=A0AAP0HKW1_9MAGN
MHEIRELGMVYVDLSGDFEILRVSNGLREERSGEKGKRSNKEEETSLGNLLTGLVAVCVGQLSADPGTSKSKGKESCRRGSSDDMSDDVTGAAGLAGIGRGLIIGRFESKKKNAEISVSDLGRHCVAEPVVLVFGKWGLDDVFRNSADVAQERRDLDKRCRWGWGRPYDQHKCVSGSDISDRASQEARRHASLHSSRGLSHRELQPHQQHDSLPCQRRCHQSHSGLLKMIKAFVSELNHMAVPENLIFVDTSRWPLIPPLPSYGRGRELPGQRYRSFIHGEGLRDVIITGENGTIDGQGDVWWNMWRQKTLKFTRPNLIELMNSKNIIISNVIFQNSPFWNIHPVYCSNVVIRYVTILAPYDSPNTDGIDPDSSSQVCIEDSYIATGDDLVAVKSGWDEYGIQYGRKSTGITIRRVTGSSPFAGIAIGSETSGGVENVFAEHINIFNTSIGIHVKTNSGRGGAIINITMSNVYMENVGTGIRIIGDVGDHPDNGYNATALPVVKGVTLKNIWGVNVQQPGMIHGIKDLPFRGICLSSINLHGVPGKGGGPWKCSDVSGSALQVTPLPCAELTSPHGVDSCSNSI